jgi:hypothetical protein
VIRIPYGHYDDLNIDSKLNEKLRLFLSSALEKNKEKLEKLKDVKTLVDLYKKTREYEQEERGISSIIANKMIEELLNQVEPFYIGYIVKRIDAETQFKKEGVVEVNSNISFGPPIKPYVKFTVEINGKESYSVKFMFQIDTSAHITKLRLISNADKGRSIDIENLGIKIEFSLLQIEFSDLTKSRLDISFNKQIKLGSKKFEIHNLSFYM